MSAMVETKNKSAATHRPYKDLVVAAVSGLRDRSGVSLHAIRKAVDGKSKNLAGSWEKNVSRAVKELVSAGALSKHNQSYKLTEVGKHLHGHTTKSLKASRVKISTRGPAEVTLPQTGVSKASAAHETSAPAPASRTSVLHRAARKKETPRVKSANSRKSPAPTKSARAQSRDSGFAALKPRAKPMKKAASPSSVEAKSLQVASEMGSVASVTKAPAPARETSTAQPPNTAKLAAKPPASPRAKAAKSAPKLATKKAAAKKAGPTKAAPAAPATPVKKGEMAPKKAATSKKGPAGKAAKKPAAAKK